MGRVGAKLVPHDVTSWEICGQHCLAEPEDKCKAWTMQREVFGEFANKCYLMSSYDSADENIYTTSGARGCGNSREYKNFRNKIQVSN